MRETDISLLMAYILHNRIAMEEEVHLLQNNIRFRKVDIADLVELMCAVQRLETFKETTDNILTLLKLK